MSAVLGINAVFHDPAAALVVDGTVIAAIEEERLSRRKHGKDPVPFSTWELPVGAAEACLDRAGLRMGDLDEIAYSYAPERAPADRESGAAPWEQLRTLYARRAPDFIAATWPDAPRERVRFVPHHLAHAASAFLAAPHARAAVMVADGRGERTSYLSGVAGDGRFTRIAEVLLPHSLGLFYEAATEHLGFRRSSDEYKVMALAAYGEPTFARVLAEHVRCDGRGGFTTRPVDWRALTPPGLGEDGWTRADADLAASVQLVLEETLLTLARDLQTRTGAEHLVTAGGVALNCVANSRLATETGFADVWVQPAAGDAGTALGAALLCAQARGDHIRPMTTAALGREWSETEIAETLIRAHVPFSHPPSIADAVAEILAADGLVAWFQGRSEWGPRALGHRSLLANPSRVENLARLNDVKGREQFRPVAPMVPADRAPGIFSGPLPSPFMLFTHTVAPEWRDRIPAVTHVDGSARIQTVDESEPLVLEMLRALDDRTGVPVCVNTSLNTGGRPMVDSPRDALECFGAGPIDALAIGPFLVERPRHPHDAPARAAAGAVR